MRDVKNKLSSATPSCTLIISDLLDLSLINSEEDFILVEGDFRRECQRYGQVLKVIAPRPIRLTEKSDLLKDL